MITQGIVVLSWRMNFHVREMRLTQTEEVRRREHFASKRQSYNTDCIGSNALILVCTWRSSTTFPFYSTDTVTLGLGRKDGAVRAFLVVFILSKHKA